MAHLRRLPGRCRDQADFNSMWAGLEARVDQGINRPEKELTRLIDVANVGAFLTAAVLGFGAGKLA